MHVNACAGKASGEVGKSARTAKAIFRMSVTPMIVERLPRRLRRAGFFRKKRWGL
jgi:hypothetical protein